MQQSDQNKSLDLICMGRVAVDFYGQQIGSRLEDMSSFSKYLGGSSGNVAYGTAQQGLKSSMLARVGDEHMGRFLQEELERVGVDTRYLIKDKDRLTALVILGIKDEDTFPLIFYRDNCADMAITAEDVSEEYIASARCLAVTGTHLSNPQTREAVLTALKYAKRNGVKTALDIDYRPILWGLTTLGDGETRFIASDSVTQQLQEVLHLFDLIVGTEEEFHISGGSTNTIEALKNVRRVSQAELVCKRGPLGCSVFTKGIPNTLDEGITVQGVQVDVLNVLGAGDAFMSGLLRGYLTSEGWEKSCAYANACGALVVSRHGCAPAMPSKEELDNYLSRADHVVRPDLDPELNHLHRVTTRKVEWPELCVLAFDHRSQFVDMAEGCGADLAQIPKLKDLIFKANQEVAQEHDLVGKSGILCDSRFGQSVLNDATGSACWIARPIELPGSRPLQLEHGNIGSQLITWPIEHVVKCLVFCHPEDDLDMQTKQDKTIKEVYEACCLSGHELLLEVILPKESVHNDEHYVQLLARFYTLGIKPDWWKLPPLNDISWAQISALIEANDKHCRGIVLLGLDAPVDELKAGFKAASTCEWVKGFAVGRTIFSQPSKAWLAHEIDDQTLVDQIKQNYLSIIQSWVARK
ncbi:bifunctional 5-dehydro-2-deoxygluconokinase/5-dehydro-2-deoxyphosphogluconate aldolase [Vibrio sp. WJH972]